jgi:putative flippase GtrA
MTAKEISALSVIGVTFIVVHFGISYVLNLPEEQAVWLDTAIICAIVLGFVAWQHRWHK